MSWELATFLSVIVLCGTTLLTVWMLLPSRLETQVSKHLEFISNRVKALEENQATVIKVASDAKKMMSEQNLAGALQPIGRMR